MASPKAVQEKGSTEGSTEGPRMYDVRPGKVVVQNMTDGVLFVADRTRRLAYTDQPAYVLQPGIPYELPPYVFSRDMGNEPMLKTGQIKILKVDRAALPEVIDLQDTYLRATIRDGHPPAPSREEVLTGYRARWLEAADGSVAECIYRLVHELGWSEEDASLTVIAEYRSAFDRKNGDVRRQSWAQLTERIIANGHGPEEVE